MKKNFKIFVCALAAVLGVSQFVACSSNDGETSSSSNTPTDSGVHGGSVSTTEHKIIANGKSEYKLVVPTEADTKTQKAVNAPWSSRRTSGRPGSGAR